MTASASASATATAATSATDAAAPLTTPAESPNGPETLRAAAAFYLSQPSPRIIVALALAGLVGRSYVGAFAWADLLIVAGVIAAWPFIEWLIHVFILHAKPTGLSRFIYNGRVAKKHRAHHRDPFNLTILFFPAHTFFVTLPLLSIGSYLALPLPRAATLVAAMTTMLLRYEWIHFLTHTRYRPRGRWYRTLWRNHRLHHCKNENYWQGVSALLGDKLLGTFPEPHAVELSPTCRDLSAATAGPRP